MKGQRKQDFLVPLGLAILFYNPKLTATQVREILSCTFYKCTIPEIQAIIKNNGGRDTLAQEMAKNNHFTLTPAEMLKKAQESAQKVVAEAASVKDFCPIEYRKLVGPSTERFCIDKTGCSVSHCRYNVQKKYIDLNE